jgi:hypothetical protein
MGASMISDQERAAAAEKITRGVLDHHPYTLCFPCLAVEHSVPEWDVRQIAQVAVLREGFRVERRICYRCNIADDMLLAPDPTCRS